MISNKTITIICLVIVGCIAGMWGIQLKVGQMESYEGDNSKIAYTVCFGIIGGVIGGLIGLFITKNFWENYEHFESEEVKRKKRQKQFKM